MKKIYALIAGVMMIFAQNICAQVTAPKLSTSAAAGTTFVPVDGAKYMFINACNGYALAVSPGYPLVFATPTGTDDQIFEIIPVEGKPSQFKIRLASDGGYIAAKGDTYTTITWEIDASEIGLWVEDAANCLFTLRFFNDWRCLAGDESTLGTMLRIDQPESNETALWKLVNINGDPIFPVTNSLTAAPADGSQLTIGKGEEREININYTADESFTGFQTQIALPDGLTFVENGTEYAVLAGNAASTHQISSNLSGNTLKVVCFSPQNDIITESPLFTIRVRASEDFEGGEIQLTNTLFSTTANSDVSFPDSTTAIEGVDSDPFTYEYNDTDMTATVTGLKSWVTELVDPVIPDTTKKGGNLYTVTTIGYSAFSNCSGLVGSLTIPNSVTEIGENAFTSCTGFEGPLTLSENLTKIGDFAFSGCFGFSGSLTLPENMTEIGSYIFCNCTGFTGSLTIPENVREIGAQAFRGCTGFTGSLILPANLTRISHLAFYGCSGFSGMLKIPDNINEIEENAFYGCSGFSGTLILPEKLKKIGSMAFSDCSWTDIKLLSRNAYSIADFAFDPEVTIRVPVGTGDAYRNSEGWSSYEKLYEFGDANIDKKLTVTDAVAVANDIIGKPNSAWDFLCADITFDEAITISDATTIISAVMEYSPAETYAASRRKVSADRGRGLVAADFSLDRNGEAVVPVSLEANGELVALQLDFAVEDGMSIEGIEIAPALAQTHSVTTRKHDDGSMRVVLFSAAGKKIGTAAPLFNVRLSGGGTGNLGVSEAIASTPDAQEVTLGFSGGNNKAITTGLEGVDAASIRVYSRNGNVVVEGNAGMRVAIYDAMGRMVDSFEAEVDVETRALQQGIYIVTVDNATYKVIL